MKNGLTSKYGDEYWFKNDILHREDGPAIKYHNGDELWYQNGILHREAGPAVDYLSGYKAWIYKGKQIDCETNEEFLRIIKLRSFWS